MLRCFIPITVVVAIVLTDKNKNVQYVVYIEGVCLIQTICKKQKKGKNKQTYNVVIESCVCVCKVIFSLICAICMAYWTYCLWQKKRCALDAFIHTHKHRTSNIDDDHRTCWFLYNERKKRRKSRRTTGRTRTNVKKLKTFT